MQAAAVFAQSSGDLTKSYYAEMNTKGPLGELAVALFRAQKRSSAAKKYRRGKFTHAAYDVKNWSLGEICRVITTYDLRFEWGWKRDPKTPGYEWVLYVDLPTGQCSFHSSQRLHDKNYPGEWDGEGMSQPRILAFCDMVYLGISVHEAKEIHLPIKESRRELKEFADRLGRDL